MKLRNFIKLALPFIPMFLSILGVIGIYISLQILFPTYRQKHLEPILYILIILSVLFTIALLTFILQKSSAYKVIGNKHRQEIEHLTQQIHCFRDIADILLESDLWTSGLRQYLDREFAGLNYFDIKEFYKGRNKLALEYIEQNNRFGETESLYLEIKSLLLNDPAQSVVEGYVNPKEYDKRILKKWHEHHVGNGIYHYFGFKYINFKEELDVNRIQEQHQDRILESAIQIDERRYQNMGFSEELLSKLGAHLSEETIPDLFIATEKSIRKVPKTLMTAITLFAIFIIFGIFLPLATLLFGLGPFFNFLSLTVISGVLLFLLLAIYPYVKKQINL